MLSSEFYKNVFMMLEHQHTHVHAHMNTYPQTQKVTEIISLLTHI